MSDIDFHKVAKEAAHEAVRETLTTLGVDMEKPLEMQEDFAWMRRYRQMSEKVGSRVIMTVITLMTVGVAGIVWSQVGNGK